jgi:hypothetical protein
VVDRQPPALGPAFPSLVSQVDGIGNELVGVRSVELRAPLATYLPWNLRLGAPGGVDELTDFLGTFIPLPRTVQEREETGDPRPSIEELYPSKGAYLERVRGATRDLVQTGLLLSEDVPKIVERAEAAWDWIMGREN